MTQEDIILQKMLDKQYVAVSKCDTEEKSRALDKLRAFGLVYESSKYHWRLTADGYRAGTKGFEKWSADRNQSKPANDVHLISIVNGNDNRINQTNSGVQERSGHNAIVSFLLKFWKELIISLLSSIIILAFEKGWLN